MNKLILLGVLLTAVGMLTAELVWPQPVIVHNYANVEYTGNSLQTSDGCHLLMWEQNDNGYPCYKLRLYDHQYQPLWETPLTFPRSYGVYKLLETSDQAFSIAFCYSSSIRAHKISRTGELLWGQHGIIITGYWVGTVVDIVADHNGGVYVSWYGRYNGINGESRCAIQHLDTSGAITMPSAYVFLDDAGSCYTNMLILPDDSVLVAWSLQGIVKVQRVNYSGQFMWTQPLSVASTANHPIGRLCAFEDSSFALCVNNYNSLDVQRYSYSGTALWPQPVTAISTDSIDNSPLQAVTGSDNSIFITAVAYYGKYLQKISGDGILQYGTGINLTTDIGNMELVTQAMPDANGGCVLVGIMSGNPGSIKTIQVSGAGTFIVYDFANNTSYKRYPSAHRYGNSICIEWQEKETMRSGLKVQILNQQYQPQLAANGMELVYGESGRVKEVKTSARTNGCAVIWDQALLATSPWDLYLQLYTSEGQPVYNANGLKINRPSSSRNGASEVCCKGNLTLVVWGEELDSVVSRRYQIIDAAGNNLLPEGGFQLGTITQSVGWVNISTYLDDWYVIWSQSNSIWGQKISGITPLWGDGIQITQPHPDISGAFGSVKLEWPWLTWTLGIRPMLACLDDNGVIINGFPQWGLDMPDQYGTASLFKHTFTVCGENMHVVLDFARTYYLYPNNHEYVEYTFTHTMINRQGDYMFNLAQLPVDINYNVFSRNNMIYVGNRANDYEVREYNTIGYQTAIHYIPVVAFSYNGWQVLGTNDQSNGNLLMFVRGYVDSSPALRHFYITPSWQLVVPIYSVVLTGGNFPPSISMLEDRAWIAQACGLVNGYNESATVSLQSVTLTGTANPNPDSQSPAMPYLVSCSPNPFNPSTSISFSLPEAGITSICVYDLKGRKTATLQNGFMSAGKHSIIWNGKDSTSRDVASGVYILRLEAGGKSHSRKVTLLK
mgnify:FL=1